MSNLLLPKTSYPQKSSMFFLQYLEKCLLLKPLGIFEMNRMAILINFRFVNLFNLHPKNPLITPILRNPLTNPLALLLPRNLERNLKRMLMVLPELLRPMSPFFLPSSGPPLQVIPFAFPLPTIDLSIPPQAIILHFWNIFLWA